jgi:hypothetical protein
MIAMTKSLLLLLSAAGVAFASEVRTLEVPGTIHELNGVDQIPVGLFGTHNVPLSPETIADLGIGSERIIRHSPGKKGPARSKLPLIVEGLFDRYQPPMQLNDPKKWEQKLRKAGARYGDAIAADGIHTVIEFWNEPYLNWVVGPGVTRDRVWYEAEGIKAGDRVTIKGQSEPTEHLIWKEGDYVKVVGQRQWHEISNDYVNRSHNRGKLRNLKVGEELKTKKWTYTKVRTLVPHDPGRPSWWSGPQELAWYVPMLRAFGEEMKQRAPEAQYIAGWGFHLFQDDWKAWEVLYKPTLEASIDIVDGVHEHHYGGDPRLTTASYEMAWNWGVLEHDKRLDFYNTEAGPNYDPQRPDYGPTQHHFFKRSISDSGELKARVQADHFLRDLLFAISLSADKAIARAAHHAHHEHGTKVAMRLLRDLRGTMLTVSGGDHQLWGIASVNDDQLVLAIRNDGTETITVDPEVMAPAGAKLGGDAEIRSLAWKPSQKEPAKRTLFIEKKPYDGSNLELAGYDTVVITWPIEGGLDQASTRSVERIPVDGMLTKVGKESITLPLPADVPAGELLIIADPTVNNRSVTIAGTEHKLADGAMVSRIPLAAGTAELTLNPGDKPWRAIAKQVEVVVP